MQRERKDSIVFYRATTREKRELAALAQRYRLRPSELLRRLTSALIEATKEEGARHEKIAT